MKRFVLYWFLLKVVGRQILLGYGIVALLSVAILASLFLASRYGLEAYVSDQIGRIPWEISVLQRGETQRFTELRNEYQKLPGVREVQGIGFLRLRNISPVRLTIANERIPVRWIAFVSASDERLLPPELREVSGENGDGEARHRIEAALVGAPGHNTGGSPQNIRAGSPVRFTVNPEEEEEEEAAGHTHDEPAFWGPTHVTFEGELARTPPQIERQEFNRWMLREVGALAYLPEEAILFRVSTDQFQALATQFHGLFQTAEGMHGGAEPPPYVPEMTHLIALDRQALVSTWDLEGSLQRLEPKVRQIYQSAQDLTPFAWVNSDLVRLLSRMSSIARLISLATLLVAVPLLWMGWVLAKWLGRLLVLNQRRLIGLALLRGISTREAGRSVLLSLVLGGFLGGFVGLLLGIGLSVLGYSLGGHPLPPWSVLLEALVYFGSFLIVGVGLALLSGREVLLFVRRLTPREAISRAEGEAAEKAVPTLSWYYVTSFLVALVLGIYKIGSWIAGRSLLLAATRGLFADPVEQALVAFEGFLNFAAVPLLLYGLAGLLLWRVSLVQKVISHLTTPLVGGVDWFVSQYMAQRRHRVAQLLFVAGMATSLSLMPQIAGDGFYNRILRGVQTSLGADVLLEFNLQPLGGRQVGPAPLGRYQEVLQPPVNQLHELIARDDGVATVEVMEQFLIPSVYIPGQSGLVLNVMEDPANYLKVVRYEDRLGLTRSFSQTVSSLDNGNIIGSQGLFRLRAIPLQKPVILGYDSRGQEILVQFGDVVAFLPGQPALGIAQREGFVEAEVDYLNYLLGADARMVISRQQLGRSADLGNLVVVPSRAVFLISTKNGVPKEDVIARLNSQLPWKPDLARWEADERKRLGKDMFVSLALENMRVYMIGSLLLACASVAAIALSNFLADRRTFGLLRLRGFAPALLVRIALSFFLLPVMAGVLVGIVVGVVSGFGLSQAIWDLPRVYGVGSFLANRLTLSLTAVGIIIALSAIFAAAAFGLGLWLFRRTAREAIRE
ncbi:MAG: hypothetical protein HY647_10265 [Acidobacteria bacterium]|nr:hypothetical protein [Acidobacteriota bacterium]